MNTTTFNAREEIEGHIEQEQAEREHLAETERFYRQDYPRLSSDERLLWSTSWDWTQRSWPNS